MRGILGVTTSMAAAAAGTLAGGADSIGGAPSGSRKYRSYRNRGSGAGADRAFRRELERAMWLDSYYAGNPDALKDRYTRQQGRSAWKYRSYR